MDLERSRVLDRLARGRLPRRSGARRRRGRGGGGAAVSRCAFPPSTTSPRPLPERARSHRARRHHRAGGDRRPDRRAARRRHARAGGARRHVERHLAAPPSGPARRPCPATCRKRSSPPRTRASTSTRHRPARRRARLLGRRARGPLAQGASTITQQLAKNLFLTPARTWRRKLQEAVLAFFIERRFTKDAILELYLNEVYSATRRLNIVGIGEAARTFFGKPAAKLTLGEAATIAGIIRAPEPRLAAPPTRARARAAATRSSTAWSRARFISKAEEAAPAARPLTPTPSRRRRSKALLPREVRARARDTPRRRRARGRAGSTSTRRWIPPCSAPPSAASSTALASAGGRDHRWLRGRETAARRRVRRRSTSHGRRCARWSAAAISPRRPFDRAVTRAVRPARRSSRSCTSSALSSAPGGVTASTLLEDRPLTLHVSGDHVWEPANYDSAFAVRSPCGRRSRNP